MRCIRIGLRVMYAFLPFCLISRILRKFGQKGTPSMLLITPIWHTHPCNPSLLQMSIETPVILPRINSLLKDPIGKEHRMEHLREKLCLSGVSGTAASLIANPRRSSSTENYKSAWREWVGWCRRRQIDPVSCDTTPIFDFLGELFWCWVWV